MKIEHLRLEAIGIPVHIWATGEGVCAVHLGEPGEEGARVGGRPVAGVTIAPPGGDLESLARALRDYFEGRPLRWDGRLDERGLTEFQRTVYDAVREVPWARTETYGGIARAIGRPGAVRAVGGALHRNPFPVVVPCHRVLREGGELGGYSCGPALKRKLLALEAGQTELEWSEDKR